MTKKIFAVLFSKGKEAARQLIGTARMEEDNRISARKYDELHKEAYKLWDMGRPGRHIEIQTEDGLVTDFGGYPASDFKSFVTFIPKVDKNKVIPLNEVMIEKGVTTQALADATGIPKRTLDQYRTGTRGMTLENGCKIAEALNVHPSELLKEQE